MQRFKGIPSKLGEQIKKEKLQGKAYEQSLKTEQENLQKMIQDKQYIKRNLRQVLDMSHQT